MPIYCTKYSSVSTMYCINNITYGIWQNCIASLQDTASIWLKKTSKKDTYKLQIKNLLVSDIKKIHSNTLLVMQLSLIFINSSSYYFLLIIYLTQKARLTLKYANGELVSVQIFHIFTNIGVQNPCY